MMQPQKNPIDTEHRPVDTSSSSSHHFRVGTKRLREPDDDPPPTDYYSIPGMSDLTEREEKQNELLCKRYQKK
eukprot:CAMPEP_0196154192 /NCGR_PEP_ID=MMETSP0910-20130528/38449_1 /TAXON_ID=49265 /ORGANISM="Thalassiosira rotula, Strain GSO102" /LENGTH=72 /DNA_ID=CAMNT_0041418155 /DNA_START=220 /DNA_END=438 /DNA_ORIENTATION=-